MVGAKRIADFCRNNYSMKKPILFLTIIFSLLFNTNTKAQCPTDSVFDLYYQSSPGNHFAYIDQVVVDFNVITSGTGVETILPSYQQFSNPVIQLEQYGNHTFNIYGSADAAYTVGIWIDINGNHLYEINEFFASAHTNFPNTSISLNFQLPMDIVSDTVDLRIAKIYDPSNLGFNGACNFTAGQGGEIEDYKAFINCNYSIPWVSFNPVNNTCDGMNELLFASTTYGQLYWYGDTTLAPLDSGNVFIFNQPPGTFYYYLENSIGGCAGIMNEMRIDILPSPVPVINSADTVYSCSAVTFDAGPGFLDYQWSNGVNNQMVTINSGYGGNLNVTVFDQNGCTGTDNVWVAIAPDAPSTYASFQFGPNFCADGIGALVYDSLIDPGTITWTETLSGNPIGAGSFVPVTLPDTGFFYYTGIINSMCGIDTAYITIYNEPPARIDSLYAAGGIYNSNGVPVLCATGAFIPVIAAGLVGNVDYWELWDLNNNFTFNMYTTGDTLLIPTSFATPGTLYAVILHMISAQGCMTVSDTLFGRSSTPSGMNIPTSIWRCSFPTTIGNASINYGIFDVLWNTSDTTGSINVTGPANYSVTVTDVSSGCVSTILTSVQDGNAPVDVFPSTTAVCNPEAYFDFSNSPFNIGMVDEYDDSWTFMNSYSQSNLLIPNMGFNEYLVATVQNSHGCISIDTTYLNFNGVFNFSLGPDVTIAASNYTILGPDYSGYIYNWSNGGNSFSTTVSTSGAFMLTINNGQGCIDSDVININLLTTGINQDKIESDFNVYPNPADDHILIDGENINAVRIYDAEGRMVQNEMINSENQIELNTSTLSKGYYIVEIISGENKVRKKLIINR